MPSNRLGKIVAIAFVIIGTLAFLRVHKQQSRFDAQLAALPSANYIEYDTHGLVPGTPMRTEKQMRILFDVEHTYKKLHGGVYPPNASALVSSLYSNCHDYGFANLDQVDRVIKNSDWQFSDKWAPYHTASPDARSSSIVPYVIPSSRPDGSSLMASAAPGTKNVLMYTDMYCHMNRHWISKIRSTITPSGFWIVLWDDGTVQRIPYKNVLYVRNGTTPGDFGIGFRGQAGLPENVRTFEEVYKHELQGR